MVTIKQLTGITGQHNEIIKRVGNGSLDPAAVKWALQNIIEGKTSPLTVRTLVLDCCGEEITVDSRYLQAHWSPEEWFRGYKCQRATAAEKWPGAVLPEPPRVFMPHTETEHPLGYVPDTFDSLWDKIVAPTGYTKFHWEGAEGGSIRPTSNKHEHTEPTWLAFDPEHGKGERPNSMWGQAGIAASEVFSALIQFPEWPLTWFTGGASAPNLSSYRLQHDGDWWYVPALDRRDDNHQLILGWRMTVNRNDGWSSPSVREC